MGAGPIMSRSLFVDLGHSNRYPGADGRRFGGKTEIEWTRAIWKSLEPLIDRKKWTIFLVPTDFAEDVKLGQTSNGQLVRRIRWINARYTPGSYLLSIHGNANNNPTARGVATCFYGGSRAAELAATALSKSYAQATGVPLWSGGAFDDRRNRYGRIGMVRDTKPFALLLEAGFVTNKLDMLVKPQDAAKGIADYFNKL